MTDQPENLPATAEQTAPEPARLQRVAGSSSDRFNRTIVDQALASLWVTDAETFRGKQIPAAVAALTGIAPQDELEGMIAAQLVGLHNASMEAMRRAMIPEQTPEG